MMRLISFLAGRALQGLWVMLVISLVAFLVRDYLGDPIREFTGEAVSEAERDELREQLGLNRPWIVQYGSFLGNAVTGTFPNSYQYKESSLQVILKHFPATFELVMATALLTILLSIPLGILCAIRPRRGMRKDRGDRRDFRDVPLAVVRNTVMPLSLIGISIPVFLIAMLLVYAFAVHGPLPASGRPPGGIFHPEGWRHLLLPTLSLTAIMLPLFIRLVRSEMLGVLSRDYIRTARAKGLSATRVYLVHGLRNTLLPVITVGGVQLGSLLAFTILTERVFEWHGMGYMFIEAVNRSDIPLVITYLVFVGFLFVVVNTLVDLLYSFVHPQAGLS